MSRRSTEMIEETAIGALSNALQRYDVDVTDARDDSDSLVEIGGQRFVVETKSIVTSAEAIRLAKEWRRASNPVVVVADRISTDGRAALAAAGVNYFDRRGHLRIVQSPLIIDAGVPPDGAHQGGPTGPLSGQVAKEVAITCLLTPKDAHGVREVATYIERAPSAVSTAMADLRDEGLLTSRNEAMIPDLFNELVSLWRVRRVPLADVPMPGQAKRTSQLELGLDDPETNPGWALTDTVGASSWGMPVVAQGDYPPDFYVPSTSVLQRAKSVLGEAKDADSRGCTVAVAPVRLVCRRRVDHTQTSGEIWPVANHVVVALDIAQDTARGLEIIDQWQPEGIVRAW